MSFCIECGAKSPDFAKFCPQCGAALVEIEMAESPAPAPIAVTAETESVTAGTTDLPDVEAQEDIEDAVNSAPSVSASLAGAADVTADEPKSKTGLLIGVGLAALLSAGGGAYALGLFDTGDKGATQSASAPVVSTPTPLPETETIDLDEEGKDPILAAYQDAIKTGRISDLGEFAASHPESSLAKDAETAAFASLNRQNSVLAYSTFLKFFPNADTSAYQGPRANADIDETIVTSETIELETAPLIRSSITTRADELAPFIEQGNNDYAVAVIDDMLSLTDLTEAEATYLLNLRAKAETSVGIAAPETSEVVLSEAEPILKVEPATLEITTPPTQSEPVIEEAEAVIAENVEALAEIEPEATTAVEIEPPAPELAYDTAAKPLERFGAITPDAATEPGECDMTFSVDTSGTPTNITASCTDPLFIMPATETVGDWSYAPATLNGVAVQQDGVIVKIKFHLE
jgi:hypothetical protein